MNARAEVGNSKAVREARGQVVMDSHETGAWWEHIMWFNNRLKLDIISKHSTQIKVRDILEPVTGVEMLGT